MKKYLTIAKAEWLDAIQSYQEVFLWVLIELVPILIMSFIWMASPSLGPEGISRLVTYYILAFTISRLTSFYFEKNVQDYIRRGELSQFLLKPITVQQYLIWDNLGGKMFNSLFLLLPVLAVLYPFFNNLIIIPGVINILLFIISLICAYFIQFYLALIFTSFGFFIEQAFAFIHLHWILDAVTGGWMLPISFYPEVFQKIIALLPFPYVYYVPISIYSGSFTPSQSLVQILISLIWIIVLNLTSSRFWQAGLKRYSSVGN